MKRFFYLSLLILLLPAFLLAETNLLKNADLETREPGFWNRVNDDGTHAIWASDTAASNPWNTDLPSEYSFKITKDAASSDVIGWKSLNNADRYWNRATTEGANKLYNVSFYVKTEGVNTNPATMDEKIYVRYSFLAGGSLIAEKVMEVDQSVASKPWHKVEDAIYVGGAPEEIYIELLMGKDATGTVWFDNIYCNVADGWAMGVFNGDAETPEGWLHWTSSSKIGYANVVDSVAHSGVYSVLLKEEDTDDDEMVFYSQPVPAQAGKWYKIGVWVKTEGVNTDTMWYPSNVVPDRDVDRVAINFFFHKAPIETDWNLVGGDQFFYIDQRIGHENSEWIHYVAVAKAPEEAAGVSMRARFNPFATGKVYWDDFSIEELEVLPNVIANPSVETREPGFWNRVNDDGTHAIWASDTAASNPWNTDLPSEYSFKITKDAASSDVIGWKSLNNADRYWNRATTEGANKLYNVSFYVKTEGVNTNPATMDEKIYVRYSFLAGGSLIAEKIMEVDQSVASKPWHKVEDAIYVGGAPEEIYIELLMGKDATGTVWFDNIYCNVADGWAMGVFNGSAETPEGWLHWTSTSKIGYANVVDSVAHSGTYSVRLEEKDNEDDEMVFYSIPQPAETGKWYMISAWVKNVGVNTDTVWYPTNVLPDREIDRIAINFFYHKAPIETDWNLVGGDQFFYVDQRAGKENLDWTLYSVLSQAPEEAAGVSMRARYNPFATGVTYWDDFAIQEVVPLTVDIDDPSKTLPVIATDYNLSNNYPNPFNPTTVIEYTVPKAGKVTIAIYDVLGRKVRTLVDQDMMPGTYTAMWDGTNDAGHRVTSGVYFYQLNAENAVITKKMTFMK
ncbi:hypothetical protein Calab_2214 [Caldithrix abyssi DSM 13497]|uniref:Por secretion system C-terminal sorting domain-containing protein n=1 Tax=Caldithrix abyssi DSM 13497 TaxID=880073 RepID=H1XWI6_CALAY|nr:T9SS type A sorting domain-containing protein [Caldithrix abyssi]APF17745.1 Por secretion system C-terminal sorting domain-containing protein [Caldithrix abyssi DSM 13497]EHO41824.1 hypothetical protein Calab_2214 [Caldithrix abyssi DSM 13497]